MSLRRFGRFLTVSFLVIVMTFSLSVQRAFADGLIWAAGAAGAAAVGTVFYKKKKKNEPPPPTNNMPKTMEEYYEEAEKQADKRNNPPEPQFEKDPKIVDLPDPKTSLRKYNDPPGLVEINLKDLKKRGKVNSLGVASPDHTKMVYTSIFYYRTVTSASSELYVMNLDTTERVESRIANAHVNKGQTALYKTGMEALNKNIYKTLTILDWSIDGQKVALKEKISYTQEGLWRTNLLVYDFATSTIKDLSEVREAIKYYWLNDGLDLSEKRWDIYPVGWDVLNNDRIIVFAYAFTGDNPKFLGSWSIDYQGNRAMLLSLNNTNFQVTQNGIALKRISD